MTNLFTRYAIGWLLGLTPLVLAGCATNTTSTSPTPYATVSSITPEEAENYARAVLAIEPSRQEAYNEIQQLINTEQVPNITCTQADTIGALPSNVQDIAVNYCNQAKRIGESQNLTMAQFNAITITAQSNPEIQQQIQNELIRLQQ